MTWSPPSITRAAPHYLIADGAAGRGPADPRRRRLGAGRQAGPGNGADPAAAGVLLGMPAVGRPG